MTRLFCLAAAALMTIFCDSVARPQAFQANARQAYIERALGAFRHVPAAALDSLTEFVDMAEKHQCRSFFDGLTLNCLLGEVKRYCAGEGKAVADCDVLTDFLVVNKVNERQLISKQDRARLAENYADYEKAYDKVLLGKRSLLVSDLLLNEKTVLSGNDNASLARRVDEYCRVTGDSKNVAWQACVSGIIWFIGTSR